MKNGEPILGKEYRLYRGGEYVCNGVFTNDKWNGKIFISECEGIKTVVFNISKWVLDENN